MLIVNYILLAVALFCLSVFLSQLANNTIKKGKIKSSFQIQSGSGDNEVMVFNGNIMEDESAESCEAKIAEGFKLIQKRRDFNHAEWLRIKAEAVAENEKKSPEELKLRSVTEAPQKA